MNDSQTLGVILGPSANQLTVELVRAAEAAAAELGMQVRLIGPTDEVSRLDTLLGIGYQRSFLDVMESGARQAPNVRRVAWVGEPLLPADEPSRSPLAAAARSRAMDLVRLPLRPLRHVPLPRALARVRSSALGERERARNVRDLHRLVGLVDRLVVTSRDRGEVLVGHGVEAAVTPFGYSPAVAGPLASPDAGDRDLQIVSLAHLDPRVAWRRAALARLRDEPPGLTAIEGVWGAERNALLRRTRVVVNIQRVPGNFIGIRLVLALAAGAAVVTEPMADSYPFVAGRHFVEAPLERLGDEARSLLADEPRRRRIVEAGQALLAEELSMARCLARALGGRNT